MPFWVNSQIVVPGTKRPLLVPVSHAEYEWFVSERGHPEKVERGGFVLLRDRWES